MLFRREMWQQEVPCKSSKRIPPTANLFCACLWAAEIARSRSLTRLFFSARRWPAKSTGKSSAPITAAELEIDYEDRTRALPAHVDPRLLRFCAPGWLHARGGASGGLLQPRDLARFGAGLVESAEQSAQRRKVRTVGPRRRSRKTLDRRGIEVPPQRHRKCGIGPGRD